MRLSILVVDDDETYRCRLAKAFHARGHEVTMADGLFSARGMVENAVFDMAVVDLQMPDGHGLELVKHMRTLDAKTRVIVLTGYGSIASALEAVRLGAVDYLTKPADAEQILSTFENPGQSFAHVREHAETSVPTLDRVEWEHIQRVLVECDYNISKAARLLGLHRRSLQRKLTKLPPNS